MFSDKLASDAKFRSKIEYRFTASQLEYSATTGKTVEEKPDLSFIFIKENLIAMEEIKQSPKEEYPYG
ncbi:MAG: hypothetical protein ABGY95_10465 [Rubritalea sp.]|uniref:TA system antitoxin ParD family protein n=1 Tax=Rubritalea sp. TaxID=2109375 RepID=UPI003242AE81